MIEVNNQIKDMINEAPPRSTNLLFYNIQGKLFVKQAFRQFISITSDAPDEFLMDLGYSNAFSYYTLSDANLMPIGTNKYLLGSQDQDYFFLGNVVKSTYKDITILNQSRTELESGTYKIELAYRTVIDISFRLDGGSPVVSIVITKIKLNATATTGKEHVNLGIRYTEKTILNATSFTARGILVVNGTVDTLEQLISNFYPTQHGLTLTDTYTVEVIVIEKTMVFEFN